MVDIQDVRELTIELNKANFVNKKPLSEEQKNLGSKISDVSLSLFTEIKVETPNYTVDKNVILKRYEVNEDELDYKIIQFFSNNSSAFYEMAAYKFIGKRKNYPTENHLFHISLFSDLCSEVYDVMFVSKKRKFFYFEDKVTDLPLIDYLTDYFVEVNDTIRGKIVRLMEDTGLEHEKLQREMNEVADDLSKHAKEKHYSLQEGVITFMDFLGWKGLWQNQAQRNPLQEVSTLIQQIEQIVDDYTKEVFPYSARLKLSKLISISDTIAIFTPKICHVETVVILGLHARIAKFVLEECVKQSYPIRGAIAIGQYNTKDNIMIGPGIDECASWHETCNWIGVHLTPSAELAMKNNPSEDVENIVIRKNIPVKNGYPKVTYCVKWYVEKNEFENLTNHVQALLPEISGKYMNTYEFLYGEEDTDAKDGFSKK
ncbi:MAG: hypothetical protein HFG32_08550 [Eubacterium sp.]|jgi:hypothetical protein|nr:hypothetical protein [Eubacterium sp.]